MCMKLRLLFSLTKASGPAQILPAVAAHYCFPESGPAFVRSLLQSGCRLPLAALKRLLLCSPRDYRMIGGKNAIAKTVV